MSSFIDENGNRYGRLLVISRKSNRGTQATWLCECDCGKEIVVRGVCLRNGSTRSCGCLRIEILKENQYRLPYGQAAFNHLVNNMKANAKAKNLDFELSHKEVKELTSSPCFYCGILPHRVYYPKGSNGGYLYNGIDRVDNSKGYVKTNVVPSCFKCNSTKGAKSVKEFLDWIERVYLYQQKKRVS